jgi:putative intracellular protease/amidase
MSRYKSLSLVILVILVFVSMVLLFADVEKTRYVCPMHCKNAVYDAPGRCPVCGMQLILEKDDHITKAAILIFDGVQIIDFAAPWEILGQARFYVYTVAANKKTITTTMNMSINPDFDFRSAPVPDLLIVPGGNEEGAIDDKTTIQWVKDTADHAKYVLSVCNGAFFLAKAGLLDGLTATTFHHLIPQLATEYPKTKVVADKRFVDNGKIITSAGLSSGMDATIYLISKMKGMGEAQQLALHLEYNWQPDSKFARASLADMNLPDINFPESWHWKYRKTQGNSDQWDLEAQITTTAGMEEVSKFLDEKLSNAKWSKAKAIKSSEKSETTWSFVDSKGQSWTATISLKLGTAHNYLLGLHLERAQTSLKKPA